MVANSPSSRCRERLPQSLPGIGRAGVEGLGNGSDVQHIRRPPFWLSCFCFWKAAQRRRPGAAMASATMTAVSSFRHSTGTTLV